MVDLKKLEVVKEGDYYTIQSSKTIVQHEGNNLYSTRSPSIEIINIVKLQWSIAKSMEKIGSFV